METEFLEDLQVVKELRGYSEAELAAGIGVTRMTLCRWRKGPEQVSEENRRRFYEFAYEQGVRLNRIREQMLLEDCRNEGTTVLFHGAKTELVGAPGIGRSRERNDFGRGFYCGESLSQAAMFVSGYPDSSVYVLRFANNGALRRKEYGVDQEWMLTIAYNRGKLGQYADAAAVRRLVDELHACDYVVAPIADNRMFDLIDEFIDGEITDVQCQHALSATNLGRQVVFLSERALESVSVLSRCYLAAAEKKDYLSSRQEENRIGYDKARLARRTYRGQGRYIDEVLG